MSDVYVECLVQTKPSPLWKFLKISLIALTVIFFLVSMILIFIFLPFFILSIACGVGAYFANMRANLEYEYLYLDKEIVVDKVMAKSKRKRVAVYSLDRIEILAPVKSYRLDNFARRNTTKVKDYSIGEELQPDRRYVMYYEGGEKVLLSPSEEMIKVMKNVAPRKVFSD